MAVMDEFKEERDLMKNRSFKEKLSYFWDYYKWYVIGGLIAFVALFSLIRDMLKSKDTVLYVALVNGVLYENASEHLSDTFLMMQDMDFLDKEVLYDTSMSISADPGTDSATAAQDYNSLQKLTVLIASKELDLMITDTPVMEKYGYGGLLADLNTLYTPQEIAAFEKKGMLYYVDKAWVTKSAEEDLEYTSFRGELADPTHPEEMEQPIPVALLISDCSRVNENLYTATVGSEEEPRILVSFIPNSSHLDLAKQYVNFLMTAGPNSLDMKRELEDFQDALGITP